jgi:serine/threonine protein phosphatase PrpC
VPPAHSFPATVAAEAAATPVTAPRGEESPLDVGWTGPVESEATQPADAGGPDASTGDGAPCRQCSDGHYLDGYCDTCGAKQPDPRDHFTEKPAPWVAGVCDIGRRHRRNEDAMALAADPAPGSFATLVVCDGVSNSTDSHIASLAASRAAREALRGSLSQGVGTRSSFVAAAERRLADAVAAADAAVGEVTLAAGEAAVDSPPSCTFVAALVGGGTAVVGNVGDSRAYWLPDDPGSAAVQLSEDDSFAAAQMSAGVTRKEAESSAGAHAITRWLGVDSPEDLTPHTRDLDLTDDGWLLVCSDGLWNYCSEAADLQALVHRTVDRLGADGREPSALAQALTDFANEAGGMDNITVALARIGGTHTVEAPDTTTTKEAT